MSLAVVQNKMCWTCANTITFNSFCLCGWWWYYLTNRCSALNGNKIKHVSEMKADIKLCTSSFSVVAVPFVYFFLVKVVF